MASQYYDKALNAHNHADPQRETAQQMMDFHPEQAFDVGIWRADPQRFRVTYLKRFNGLLTRDASGKYLMTVTDTLNTAVQRSKTVSAYDNLNALFQAATDLAELIVNERTTQLWREMGFVEAD